LLEVGEKRRLISLLAMGQRHRRAVYGKSVRAVRWGDGGRKTSSYSAWLGLVEVIKNVKK